MIVTLIVFFYLLFLLFSIGFLGRVFVSRIKFITLTDNGFEALDHLLLFGLVILTTVLSFVSIFSKIGLWVHLVIFLLTFSGVVYYRALFYKVIASYVAYLKSNRSLAPYILVIWPLILIGLVYASGPITSYDTGLYHAQFIRWISEYRAVPGLAWIHERFGFNSHFHIACAFFDFSFLKISDTSGASIIFYPLNSFLFFVFLFRCVFSVHKWIQAQNSFFVIIYSLLPVLVFLSFGPAIQSPSPDIATSLLTFYVFLIFLEDLVIQKGSGGWTFDHVLLVGLILLLITFKLTAALVVLLLPLLLLFNRLSWRVSALFAAMGCIVIIPYLIRNTILTGWLVYPFPQLDLFSFDWKLPVDNVLSMTETIKGWARARNLPAAEVAAMPIREWLPLWWKNLNASSYLEKMTLWILYINLASPLLFLPVLVLYWNDVRLKIYAGAFLVLTANLLFWFLNAPDIRFATGFLFFNFVFLLACLLAKTERFLRPWVFVVASLLLFGRAFEVPAEYNPYITHSLKRNTLSIYPYQIDIPLLDDIQNDDHTLIIRKPTKDDRCFNAPVPCSPNPRTFIKLRGSSIEDGFYYPTK